MPEKIIQLNEGTIKDELKGNSSFFVISKYSIKS